MRVSEDLGEDDTARSAGVSDSRTTMSAKDTDSARNAGSAASGTVSVITGSGSHGPI